MDQRNHDHQPDQSASPPSAAGLRPGRHQAHRNRSRMARTLLGVGGLLLTTTLVASAATRDTSPATPPTGPTPAQVAAACHAEPNAREAMTRAEPGEITLDGTPRPRPATAKPGLPPAAAQAKPRTTPVPATERCDGMTGEGTPQALRALEASNPYSTRQLNSPGGWVQSNPRIYLVLWGASWSSSIGDPHGTGPTLHNFYASLVNSRWSSPATQYAGPWGGRYNPAGVRYMGWLLDTTAVPARPTDADIRNAVWRAATRMRDVSPEVQYIVATPWGTIDEYSLTRGACGWHGWATLNGAATTYTMLPYNQYLNWLWQGLGGCGGGAVNGWYGANDGTTIVAGHEFIETATDALLNAWGDIDGHENADKCSWKNLGNVRFPNGRSFAMQPHWSNADRASRGNGCILYSN